MFSFLKSKNEKLINAIKQGDLKALSELLKRTDIEALHQPLVDECCSLELAISSNQAKALELLLSKGANPNLPCQLPLSFRVLEQEDSLALLTALLQKGANPDQQYNQLSLLEACYQSAQPNTRLLLISRLIEYGVTLKQHAQVLVGAIETGDQALIQLLINSGLRLSESDKSQINNQNMLNYANRLQQDYEIRQMMLNP